MEVWGSTSIGILLLGMSACSPLESIVIEPEMSDLQLRVDTLNASLRDAQRTVAELRAEVDARRQELADLQIARAQLEGRIRETDRRLAEARQVVGLQREELGSSRSVREEARRTQAALQNQLKQLQKQVSKAGKQVKGNVSPAALASPPDGQHELVTIELQQDARLAALEVPKASSFDEVPVGSRSATVAPRIQMMVKSGDTLWGIARRYHTSVRRLMVLNALTGDRIQVGQALWLTEPATEKFDHERT